MMITDPDLQLLRKMGVIVTRTIEDGHGINYAVGGDVHISETTTHGEFIIDDAVFSPMCRLIRIVDLINKSKNPAIEEQLQHLITMLELSK